MFTYQDKRCLLLFFQSTSHFENGQSRTPDPTIQSTANAERDAPPLEKNGSINRKITEILNSYILILN